MYVGIDIGGTNTRIALVSRFKKIIKKIEFPTKDSLEFLDELIGKTKTLIDTHWLTKKNGVESIGIGFPSIFDSKGNVYETPNIKTWENVSLKKSFEKKLKVKTYVDNDANCFSWGEKLKGKLKPFSNGVAVILGTGVGCGIIINNKLYSGLMGGAGEIGKIDLFDSKIEDYCSGRFFEKEYNKKGEDIFKEAKKNKTYAKKIFFDLGKYVGYSLLPIIHILSPQAIVLGGSIGQDFRFYEKSLLKILDLNVHFKKIRENINILSTENMDSSLIGAAFLFCAYDENKKNIKRC